MRLNAYHRETWNLLLNSQVTKSSFKTKKAWVHNLYLTSLNHASSLTVSVTYFAAAGFGPHRFRPP